MNHRCEHLRTRAMEHGEGSEEYAAWVFHCRHCSDCQSELFILETLREDAEGEKVHLPREKVAQLAMMAQARYGKRRKHRAGRMIWGLVWKVSALAAMITLLLRVVPLEWGKNTLENSGNAMGALMKSMPKSAPPKTVPAVASKAVKTAFDGMRWDVSDMGGMMVLSPGEVSYERQMITANDEAAAMDLTELLPGQAFDKRIFETSKKIERQREELNELIDHDLTGY